MNRYIQEAKAFALRGNVLEFTVAVIFGFAFIQIVRGTIDDIIAPIISMIFGERSMTAIDFDINDSVFFYGDWIEQVIIFAAIVGATVLFIIGPAKKLRSAAQSEGSPDPDTRLCPECLSAIPAAARRCAYCTATSSPSTAPSSPAAGAEPAEEQA